jgi:hypothetical protein
MMPRSVCGIPADATHARVVPAPLPVRVRRHHAAVREQEQAADRWRRAGPTSWRYVQPTGDLAEDGAAFFVFRTDVPDERCPACRRRGLLWRVDLGLPPPFPAIGTAGRGCTRDHALQDAPKSWAELARYFAALAAAVRNRDPITEWDARHADMRAGQAARAALLSGWVRLARQLALRLWCNSPGLDVETTDMIVAGVLSEPDPQSGQVAP